MSRSHLFFYLGKYKCRKKINLVTQILWLRHKDGPKITKVNETIFTIFPLFSPCFITPLPVVKLTTELHLLSMSQTELSRTCYDQTGSRHREEYYELWPRTHQPSQLATEWFYLKLLFSAKTCQSFFMPRRLLTRILGSRNSTPLAVQDI